MICDICISTVVHCASLISTLLAMIACVIMKKRDVLSRLSFVFYTNYQKHASTRKTFNLQSYIIDYVYTVVIYIYKVSYISMYACARARTLSLSLSLSLSNIQILLKILLSFIIILLSKNH